MSKTVPVMATVDISWIDSVCLFSLIRQYYDCYNFRGILISDKSIHDSLIIIRTFFFFSKGQLPIHWFIGAYTKTKRNSFGGKWRQKTTKDRNYSWPIPTEDGPASRVPTSTMARTATNKLWLPRISVVQIL